MSVIVFPLLFLGIEKANVNYKSTVLCIATFVFAFGLAAQVANQATFNFPKGAEWTYQGAVKWEVNGKPQQKMIEWKMQILDKVERSDGICCYLLKGHPLDLAFYSPETKPIEFIYVVKKDCVYEIRRVDHLDIERMKNADLKDLMKTENIVFDFPLTQGKQFGNLAGERRTDGMYCWVVEEQKRSRLTGVKGIGDRDVLESKIIMRTNPDHQIVSYAPGAGITRFQYVHHGTLSEVDVKLIEYSPAAIK
jgi:hypothetical protein